MESLVIVPTLIPLQDYHLPAGNNRTVCGLSSYGYYPLTITTARDNADRPCSMCFPRQIPTQR